MICNSSICVVKDALEDLPLFGQLIPVVDQFPLVLVPSCFYILIQSINHLGLVYVLNLNFIHDMAKYLAFKSWEMLKWINTTGTRETI